MPLTVVDTDAVTPDVQFTAELTRCVLTAAVVSPANISVNDAQNDKNIKEKVPGCIFFFWSLRVLTDRKQTESSSSDPP